MCLANDVVSSYTLKTIIVSYANLLAKCFLKHNMSYLITWSAHKGSNITLNVDGCSLDNPDVASFGGVIRNTNDT